MRAVGALGGLAVFAPDYPAALGTAQATAARAAACAGSRTGAPGGSPAAKKRARQCGGLITRK